MTSGGRSPQLYDKQRRRIEAFLQSGISREDAAATASKGYRLERLEGARDSSRFMAVPRGVPKCTEQDCRCPSRSRAPRWEHDVISSALRQPRHLRELVPLGMAELPLQQRIILWLHGTWGLSFREIATDFGWLLWVSKSTAERRWSEAIDFLVRWVYDDQDQIRWTHSEAG